MMLGFNPWVGTNTEGKDVEKPERVFFRNLLDAEYPTAMGVVSADSKVYMIGGIYDPKKCSPPKHFISNLVYEFSGMGDGDLSLRHCDSIPLIPTEMPCPVVEKVKGKIYVLFSNCSGFIHGLSGNDGRCYYDWDFLDIPPYYEESKCGYPLMSTGVFGNKLLVHTPEYYSFDVQANNWEKVCIDLGDIYHMITLSSSSELYSVVIYAVLCSATDLVEVYAALLDAAGKPLRIQHIPDVMPDKHVSVSHLNLIELEKDDPGSSNISTFCLVFSSYRCEDGGCNVGLSVVSVSLLLNKEEEVQEPKRQNFSDESAWFFKDLPSNDAFHLEKGEGEGEGEGEEEGEEEEEEEEEEEYTKRRKVSDESPFESKVDMGFFNDLPSNDAFLEAVVVEKRQYELPEDVMWISGIFKAAFFL